ncbi:effector-associated constant component EACC1 [Streptomyces sp. BH055]|uniref:effector-associated constant component EACC1 n=1 Tax=Streptomyces sp. BH055 TaxID=3401173 RepID=UPI003BB67FDE
MKVQITLAAQNRVDDLVSLAGWLRTERALQGQVHLQRQAPSQDKLGSTFELISVAVGSGGVMTALVTSLQTWINSRRTEQKIAVTVGDRSVEIVRNGADPVAEAELLRLVKEALDGE